MTDAPDPASTAPRPATTPGPLLEIYRWALTLFLVAGAVQIFLAGFGAFSGGFDAHRGLGFGMAGLAVVILVLALVARVGTRDVVLAVVLVLLAGAVQSLLAGLGEDGAFWGGLHALDGLAILGIAGFLQGAAIRRVRAATPVG
jgi:Family of unknown function (DUF6220)